MTRKRITEDVPLEAAIAGVRLGIEHVAALLGDAEALLDAGRPLRAVTLSVIALEESGKIARLLAVERYRSSGRMSEWWRMFRDHRSKLTMHAVIGARAHADELSDAELDAIGQGQWARTFDAVKMQSLYLDFENGRFISPAERFTDPGLGARQMIDEARRQLEHNRAIVRVLTPKLIEEAARLTDAFTSELTANGLEGADALRRVYESHPETVERLREVLRESAQTDDSTGQDEKSDSD